VADERYQAKFRTRAEIRARGAIGNLQDGPTITTHGLATRLIAWPGNGFQTEAVHVLTLPPGTACDPYAYTMAEEAMLGLAGSGEVLLRDQWRQLQAGDVAYFPEGVVHAVRNPADAAEELVLVTQITPPQFDLYETAGFYDRAQGTLNLPTIFKATLNAHRVDLPTSQMAFHDDDSGARVQNLAAPDVRHGGALFNVYLGTPFPGLGLPAQLVLWPGAGTRTAGFNFALAPAHATDNMHVHPVSDECLVLWEGECEGYTADGYARSEFIALETYDVILAPCGVLHGHRSVATPSVLGGFASPPQLDLLIDGAYYENGVFSQATFERLDTAAVPGLDLLR
jgi:quercetin dioxygenase-like cupin family protein